MALTKVSPSLFQVSNNITSVTVGGSANTISLTFDSNGVITGATNNAVSVANTAITGTITAAQIAAVSNTAITGLIQAAQIGSANASLVTSGTLPTARLPAGTVVQVVNATTTSETGNFTSTYSDTTLTATITPRFATSKILVLVSQNGLQKQVNNTNVQVRLLRGANVLQYIDSGAGYTATSTENAVGGISTSYLDSPETTSATTYKTQFASRANNQAVYVQWSYITATTSTITLMEIAQ